MNVYSRLTGLAGITGTSFTLIDDSKNQKSLIATNIDGELNISGQIDDVQLTNNFVVDGFLNVSIEPFNTLELTSTDVIIKSKKNFVLVNENNDNVLTIDNTPIGGETHSEVKIDADKVDINAKGEFYVDGVKVVNAKQIPQLVIFKNPLLTPVSGVATWTLSMPEGVYFKEVPMMQIVENLTGRLKLCDVQFNIDEQVVTIIMDNLANPSATIPVNKYKLMLFGYRYNNEIKNG